MESEPLDCVADWLAGLPAAVPRRAVVLVASERHAHAIRRQVCVDRSSPEHLAGVRLLTAVEFGRELLARNGEAVLAGGETIRRTRLGYLFDSAVLAGSLLYFDAEQLRDGQGYADAFTRAIDDLESAGLDPAAALDVARRLGESDPLAGARLHDLARSWEQADGGRGATAPRILARAATALEARRDLAAGFGPVLAWIVSAPSTRLLRFLAALPDCRTYLQDARPLRPGTQRWRAAVAAVPSHVAASPAPAELELVKRFVFEDPAVLTDPGRPRSKGPDGSVEMEEHPGIEEEVEAAAQWVLERLRGGVAAERIALVVPDTDPYAGLLVDRLGRAGPIGAASPAAHVAGGFSLGSSPGGLRWLAVLRAIARGLEVEATLHVLTALRHPNEGNDDGSTRHSPGEVAALVYAAGIVGGSPGGDSATGPGTAEWVPRLAAHRDRLRALVTAHETCLEAGGPAAGHARKAEYLQAKRRLREIEALLPGVSALQSCALLVLDGAPLEVAWREVRALCRRWIRVPADPPDLSDLLDRQLEPVLADPIASRVHGVGAVRLLADIVRRTRHPTGRFGSPCVFIGTAAQTTGLRFTAVRILGLAEGVLPHTAHDDPILPDVLRARIESEAHRDSVDVVVPRLADRVLDEIHDVFRVVLGVDGGLSLSAPRQWVDRSERAVSGILLEVATALGRAGKGEDEGDVPTAARLRSSYLHSDRPAPRLPMLLPRTRLAAAPRAEPQAEPRRLAVPAGWTTPGALALDRLWELAGENAAVLPEPDAGTEDTVGPAWESVTPPGLSRRRPLSATALRALLECPYRFLLERVLYLHEPPRRPSSDVIDPILYGALLHSVADLFFRAHGSAFCRHEGTLEAWSSCARGIALERFEAASASLPLRGAEGMARERARLLRQVEQLVRYEWRLPVREFVASELEFGDPDPVELTLDAGSLLVRGAVDRVDRVGPAAFVVRDLKSGRVADLSELPLDALYDLQIGLYVLALETAAPIAPGRISEAAYVHPSATLAADRRFVGGDLELLRRTTLRSLAVARGLLESGSFPRTPDAANCGPCPFAPACGEKAADGGERVGRLPEGHPARAFVQLRRRGTEGER